MKYSKVIVSIIIFLNITFAFGSLYVFLRVGSEPITLTTCWFAFTTGELWLLSGIKKIEIKKSKEDNNEN